MNYALTKINVIAKNIINKQKQRCETMNKQIELERIGKMMGYRRKEIIQMETRIDQYKFSIMKLYKEIKDLEKKYQEVKNAN